MPKSHPNNQHAFKGDKALTGIIHVRVPQELIDWLGDNHNAEARRLLLEAFTHSPTACKAASQP